jgi:hypothetical protein
MWHRKNNLVSSYNETETELIWNIRPNNVRWSRSILNYVKIIIIKRNPRSKNKKSSIKIRNINTEDQVINRRRNISTEKTRINK